MNLNSAVIAPAVERVIGNDEVTGSNPVDGTILLYFYGYFVNYSLNILIILYQSLLLNQN